MITRIKIDGFKSLLNTELYFGPFTCIAGANAVGKSNFFDALMFLSNLADQSILQAVKSIRSENHKHANIKDIFFKSGDIYYDKMSFEVDLLIPKQDEDDLGQHAMATITSLRYILEFKLIDDAINSEKEPIEIIREELVPITLSDMRTHLFFDFNKSWLNSILQGRRSTKIPFISTDKEKIKLHQDGNKGRTTEFIAEKMPRTLLSTVTAESPTAFLARQEMRNWMMLQFEPSTLRQPNSIYEVKNARILANGFNLPATLYRLNNEKKELDIYQSLTNKLKRLVGDIKEIDVDKDEKRDLLTLRVKFKDNLILPAQSLSDGTLRFLGLAVIQEDSSRNGLICMEEPENGINPKRIEEMVRLLEDIATDTTCPVDENNPLRQVIINSHSPKVVSIVSDESLYLAHEKEIFLEKFNKKVKYTSFSALRSTWKTDKNLAHETAKGDILFYLEYSAVDGDNQSIVAEPMIVNYQKHGTKKKTVRENILQMKLDFLE
ncbi:MAG: AAA family ATPase [Chitinophagales bacterium]|nr:AAA family ATPase [Chitinophagales bacterium]